MVKRSIVIVGIIAVLMCLQFFRDELPLVKTPAYLSNIEPYLNGYEKAGEVEKIEDVKGIIINHHFFANQYMAEIIQTIKSNELKTVVLLSPNHFFTGSGNIQIGNIEFDTPFGLLEPDTKTISKLSNQSDSSFSKEHGITGIVGFIKKEIPNAKIIPIISKDYLDENELDEFAQELYKKIPKDSVIIASLDFSHYVPLNYAKFQDEMALNTIQNFDLKRINKINIDSVPTLKLMLKLMNSYGYNKFNLVSNSSSSILQNDYQTLENTSYITGYFTKQKLIKEKQNTNIFIASQNFLNSPEPFRFISGADFVFLNYSKLELNKIPSYYKKYGARELSEFENEQFSVNKKCQANKLGIEVKNNSTENKIEYQNRCLKIGIKRGEEFDLGISMYDDHIKIYYLPTAKTGSVNTELNFVQGVSIIKY